MAGPVTVPNYHAPANVMQFNTSFKQYSGLKAIKQNLIKRIKTKTCNWPVKLGLNSIVRLHSSSLIPTLSPCLSSGHHS